ncbi:Aminomethyltransferase [Trypanosoma cruzi]|nr:Aminomethyltransferase [Trypanosoma cruzi]
MGAVGELLTEVASLVKADTPKKVRIALKWKRLGGLKDVRTLTDAGGVKKRLIPRHRSVTDGALDNGKILFWRGAGNAKLRGSMNVSHSEESGGVFSSSSSS